MATATSEQTVKGGAWLVGETDPSTVMTPEKITEEHALIRQTAVEFIDGEVVPVNDRLEQKEWPLARQLMQKCGELGLLGTNIPEEYGGVDLDKIATLVVSEALSHHASSAHPSARRPTSRSCRSTCSAPRRRNRNTCRAWWPAR